MSIPKVANAPAPPASAPAPASVAPARSAAAGRLSPMILIWNVLACGLLLFGVFSGFALLATMDKETADWAVVWGGSFAGCLVLALATRTVALCLELATEGRS